MKTQVNVSMKDINVLKSMEMAHWPSRAKVRYAKTSCARTRPSAGSPFERFELCGPSDIHILAGHNAIVRWRMLMGPTKVYQAQYNAPETIRGIFGLSDTRNATHGSDSPDSAEKEIKIFFKDFDTRQWIENEEIFFNLGRLKFDPSSFVHTIDKSYVTDDDRQSTK
ncbi:nucleoside diphosphate kinase 6 isoform X2 [Orussus abietinus]|uniref:nucleoside diphosphate kinase 6 isoform X2 n=1 Tax=Orussus abietinus TaxID=222816 RepID=UPI000624F4A2|nr:nucleoside diphosphate kinase 6 isoform X2 [Orussus abietinus]